MKTGYSFVVYKVDLVKGYIWVIYKEMIIYYVMYILCFVWSSLVFFLFFILIKSFGREVGDKRKRVLEEFFLLEVSLLVCLSWYKLRNRNWDSLDVGYEIISLDWFRLNYLRGM